MPETLLKLENVSAAYGELQVLNGVDISIDEGEIVALMGPNGAGKSTVLKAIFGLVPTTGGRILWHERPFKPVAHRVVEMGMAFVPQGRRVFSRLTVRENLEIGGFSLKDKSELQRRLSEVLDTFPVLKAKSSAKAGTLSGGQQQMLAVARGLMVDPKVLLLDEPSLGLAPKVVKEVFAKIKEINEKHQTAIMVVEHNIKSLLAMADRAYVLDKGCVAAADSCDALLKSAILEKVFLGKL